MRTGVVLKALTVHAPWAWAIVHAHKRFENRGWAPAHRGPLAIHAGISRASDAAAAAIFAELGIEAPSGEALEALRGRVLGVVQLSGVATYPDAGGDDLFAPEEGHDDDQGDPYGLIADPFACGPKCWVLTAPQALAVPLACSGQQGLWNLPAAIIAAL